MKFEKTKRYTFVWSNQKAAAYQRKIIKSMDQAGLFIDEIKENLLDADQEKVRRIEAAEFSEVQARIQHANYWRKARATFYALPKEIKVEVQTRFNDKWIPKQPWYLLDIITSTIRKHENNGVPVIFIQAKTNPPQQFTFLNNI